MSSRKHILILDPIPFAGGSKVATKHILQQLEGEATRISILTADPQSWAKSDARITRLRMPKKLERTEQGIAYFLRHGLIALQVLWLRLFIGKVDVALAASGPGVDLGLYLARLLAGFDIVQMIHGPVAAHARLGGVCWMLTRCSISTQRVIHSTVLWRPPVQRWMLMSFPISKLFAMGCHAKHGRPSASMSPPPFSGLPPC